MNGLFCISTIISNLSNKKNRSEMTNVKCQNELIRSFPSYDNLWDEIDRTIMQKLIEFLLSIGQSAGCQQSQLSPL